MNDRFLKTGIFLAPFHALGENPLPETCVDVVGGPAAGDVIV